MNEHNLRNCPFCGNAVDGVTDVNEGVAFTPSYTVACHACEFFLAAEREYDAAVAKWNRRPWIDAVLPPFPTRMPWDAPTVDQLNRRQSRECSRCHGDLTMAESLTIVNEEYWCLKCFTGRDPAGWLPIETAPKDGTAILVYCPHGQYIVKWLRYATTEGIEWWYVRDNTHGPYPLRGASPTHWMSLPPGPAA